MSTINPMVLPGLKSLEEIASEIWEVPVESITTKTREREVVEARQVLVTYRVYHLKQSAKSATSPYSLHRSTVYNCMKTVNDLKDTNREFRSKYEEFLQKAKQLRP